MVHNLLKLVILPELCGFCCFSMQFFDLLVTIMCFLFVSVGNNADIDDVDSSGDGRLCELDWYRIV